MNKQQYDQLRKYIQSLEYKLKDMLDDPGHADARRFKDDLRRVEDALQTQKNPRTIEADVKRLEHAFKTYDNLSVISQSELNTLENAMEHARNQLRKFDNY